MYVVLPMPGLGMKCNREFNWSFAGDLYSCFLYRDGSCFHLYYSNSNEFRMLSTSKYVYLQIPFCLIYKVDQTRCRVTAMMVFPNENFRGMKS